MKLDEKKFFASAKENKFEACDLFIKRNSSTSVSLYHSAVDSLTQNETLAIVARGIINGKFGSVTTEVIDKNTPEFLINSIKRTAKNIENDDPSIIFKGSEKYHKKNVFNKAVLTQNIQEKIEILKEIEKKLYAFDKRINDVVSVSYEEGYAEERLTNSYGLKLSNKEADYAYVAEVTVKDGEEVRSGYKFFVSFEPSEFNIDKFVADVANDALKKLGSTQCKTKKYPLVLNPETASTLIKYLVNSADAEDVQKKTSLFAGKLHQQVVSKKLTISENPLKKTIFFRYFDEEGVATNKKFIIKKGELMTYLHTLQTAKKDGVEPTGNGYRSGGKTSAGTSLISVKPGKKSEAEMISKIKEGIYITELEGLHAGMNSQSGNFSLQAAGNMIRDGKIAEPLSLITIAGNLIEIFNEIKEISNNCELIIRNEMECPSIFIKKISVSGK